jgi:hypothetical protein
MGVLYLLYIYTRQPFTSGCFFATHYTSSRRFFALDILAIPTMSAEPEWLLETEKITTLEHRSLLLSIIEAVEGIKSFN